MDALDKVVLALQSSSQKGRKITDVTSLLTTYMLGVVSTINDMLQDLQGKKPASAKQKMLKGLGVFMELVGSPISTISPQVCFRVSYRTQVLTHRR
jgi:serine/threonine-protein kinase ATR